MAVRLFGVTAIFLPLINIQAPIIGQFRWSAFDVITSIVQSKQENGPSFANMAGGQLGGSEQPQDDESKIPWTIRQAIALPFALSAIFICVLVIAGQLAKNINRRFISIVALIGLALSGYALISIFMLGSGLRDSMMQGMPSGQDNAMVAGLGQMMVASFNIEPGVAVYLLLTIMTAIFLAQKLDVRDQSNSASPQQSIVSVSSPKFRVTKGILAYSVIGICVVTLAGIGYVVGLENLPFVGTFFMTDASRAYHEGVGALENADYEKAIEAFDRAILNDSSNPTYFVKRGDAYLLGEKYERSIQDYSNAISLNPKDAKAFTGRGRAYASLKKHEMAISDFSTSISLNSSDPEPYQFRGKTYVLLQQFDDKAIQDYSSVINLSPNDASAYLNRALVYRDKQPDLAIQDYTSAIRLNSSDTPAYISRGAVYVDLKQFNMAIQDYSSAINLAPNYVDAYLCRAVVYSGVAGGDQQHALAIKDYTSAIGIDSKRAKLFATGLYEVLEYGGMTAETLVGFGGAEGLAVIDALGSLIFSLKNLIVREKLPDASSMALSDYNSAIKFIKGDDAIDSAVGSL